MITLLASGPWTDAGYGSLGQFTSGFYETAVYYCYNKIAGIFCFTSFDGGATFEMGGQIIGLATTNGGLHGAISTAPDGTVYVTPRVATPTVIVSKDNGFSWFERSMGTDVNTPNPRKNSEVSTDSDSNAYHVWTGADEGIYMSRSIDSGESWEQESIRISPEGVISTVFPQTDAGDPGRIAITYLGSENSEMLNESDIDGNPWNGNAHYAPNNATYHLYITYSLNALDENPVFHTYRVTDDPVQVGSICLNSVIAGILVVRIVIYLTSMTCTSTDKDGSMSPLQTVVPGIVQPIQMLVLQTLVMEGDLCIIWLQGQVSTLLMVSYNHSFELDCNN